MSVSPTVNSGERERLQLQNFVLTGRPTPPTMAINCNHNQLAIGGTSSVSAISRSAYSIFQWAHLTDFDVVGHSLLEVNLKGCDFNKFHLQSSTLETMEISGLCTSLDSTVTLQ